MCFKCRVEVFIICVFQGVVGIDSMKFSVELCVNRDVVLI